MNMLSLFPLIPLVMMLGLWISKSTRQIHAVMVTGSSLLLVLAVILAVKGAKTVMVAAKAKKDAAA